MQHRPFRTTQELGAACREARHALGLSLVEAALAAGVNYRFASEIENGKATARIGLALDYAAALGLRLFLASHAGGDDAAAGGAGP